jgi:phosphate starvation-inducible PhoH-like protein
LVMLTTRIGEGSHMFMTGDTQQSDIGNSSGLPKLISVLSGSKYPVVALSKQDVVRDPIVQDLLNIYDQNEEM